MQDFELIRDVTIGQYIPTDSVIHRLDPRTKLIVTAAFFMAITATRQLWLAAGLLLLLFVLIRVAQLPLLYVLRGLRPIMPIIIVLFIFQALFQGRVYPCETVYFEWYFIVITPCLIEIMILGLIRVVAFLLLFSLLTLTTTSSQLAHSVEILLSPLQRIGVPVHELSLAYLIALRFVPTLAEEVDRVAKAQASRGGGMSVESRWRVDQIARARLPLVVPLFINALQRGEELIVAMEARGYVGGKGRTKYVQLHSRPLDWFVATAAILMAAGLWWYSLK